MQNPLSDLISGFEINGGQRSNDYRFSVYDHHFHFVVVHIDHHVLLGHTIRRYRTGYKFYAKCNCYSEASTGNLLEIYNVDTVFAHGVSFMETRCTDSVTGDSDQCLKLTLRTLSILLQNHFIKLFR